MKREKNYGEVVEGLKKSFKFGDMDAIAKANGFSPLTLRKAFYRDSWESLTKGERDAVLAAIEYMNNIEQVISSAEIKYGVS